MNSLIPFEPVKLIHDMHNVMDNLWQRAFDIDTTKLSTSQWSPAIDLKEEKDRFVVLADLPGVNPKDVKVLLENNVLTLKGKREETREEDKGTFYRMERMQGQFLRQFTLPASADNKKITAKSKQGVIEVIIPKKANTETTKVEVKIEE